MPPGDVHDRIHIDRMTVEMHRYDPLGPRRDLRLEQFGIQVEGTTVIVHKNRGGAATPHRIGAGDIGQVRDQNLIAWPQVQSHKGQVQGRGPVVDGYGMLDVTKRSKSSLEIGD